MNEIIERAKWLYTSNGGNLSKYDAAKQAVNELMTPELMKELQIFDVTTNDIIDDLTKQLEAI